MTRERDKQKQALVDFLNSAEAMRAAFPISYELRDLPPEWDEIDLRIKDTPKKEKITIRVDEDVVKFFRGLGPHYTTRMNYVLRTFAMGRLAKILFDRSGAVTRDEILEGRRQKSLDEQLAELEAWERR